MREILERHPFFEKWTDPVSGDYFDYDIRIWLMTAGNSRFEPLRPGDYNRATCRACHEWWSHDGKMCWVDYERGIYECDVDTRETSHVWKEPLCHGHCDSTGTRWCADESPYKWTEKPCQVKYYRRGSEKAVDIVSGMPPPPVSRNWYHIDPHPQFSPRDTCIVYTTTVRGLVDIALAPTDNLM